MLNVSHFNDNDDAPLVSEPERAILEMLSDIPVDQLLLYLHQSDFHQASSKIEWQTP
jgi:hypothetical protein